ncbi:MAG: hypothetical protein A3B10_01785 [Candidatus Doudnabacteria bacterium RIFCSPLOWO2_01_FULL_44_21]|uniref:bAvd-like domain-containing protein n=1 Tax=Candidatus Doudnabacteria bacterium RIFCSPLOWO2_01_FULL_44_21 TaxID=1817841 RepID=A0A1F5Q2Q0_9BACT|nr:MAG: hypothetical protein A3B95_01665 [Candidatus Doudnabacteria bacterium RIFCSPHIGHO2_02_FULL_43_13b]OGE96397.1 MAG: hypothetical protein A3B10_01785 [Candidatus Doudnabacteria bacterium RIFCSPLOWO2_01_FULL_44_21]
MQDLPILHKLSEFYKLFYLYREKFPQKDKYALGGKLEQALIESLELLFAASVSAKDQKNQILTRAAIKFDLLKFLVRVAKELKIMDLKKYVALESQLIEIGKMLGGWQRSLKENSPQREFSD